MGKNDPPRTDSALLPRALRDFGVALDAAARAGTDAPAPDDARDEAEWTFKDAAIPAATKNAYVRDWLVFVSWCRGKGVKALPASSTTLCAFLTDRATRDWPRGAYANGRLRKSGPDAHATLERRLATISVRHIQEGFVSPWKDPEVRRLLRGMRKTRSSRQDQATPLLAKELALVLTEQTGRWAIRNRALLHVGWAACLREREIVGLDVEHVTKDVVGNVLLYLPTSKTDREGKGTTVLMERGAPGRCPVADLDAQLGAIVGPGPVFRKSNGARLSRHAVDAIVQRSARAAGLPRPDGYSGHSLRAGFATQAALSGIPEWRIQKQGRWASVEMVRRYTRPAELTREPVTRRLWEEVRDTHVPYTPGEGKKP